MKNRNLSLLEEILLGVYENKPETFYKLRQQICRHEEGSFTDTGELIFCPVCHKREVPAPVEDKARVICAHEFAERHADGWVIYCENCGLKNEPHEPINPMDMREGK